MEKSKIKKALPRVKTNVALKNHTTFKIGGKAKYFFEAQTKQDIIKALKVAKELNLPFFILGGGSNVLISDKGFNGLVIKIQKSKFKIQNCNEKLRGNLVALRNEKLRGNLVALRSSKFKIIDVEAGIPLALLVSKAVENRLTGLEWAIGIPGTIGGALYGNASAFSKSIGDFVRWVEVLDIKNLKIKKLSKRECKFGYKNSIFKKKKNYIILEAEFLLKEDKKEKIQKKIKDYLRKRKATQPLKFPSAGCIFQNPKSKIQNPKLLKEFPELKAFNKKGLIPAGYLIDKCGLKGETIGGAKISEIHANFIINFKNAKAKDVLELIKLVKKTVKNKFKITLEEEIQILGVKSY